MPAQKRTNDESGGNSEKPAKVAKSSGSGPSKSVPATTSTAPTKTAKSKAKRRPRSTKSSKQTVEANSHIIDNRRRDADGLPHTTAPIFVGGHMLRSIRTVNDVQWAVTISDDDEEDLYDE